MLRVHIAYVCVPPDAVWTELPTFTVLWLTHRMTASC